MNQRLRPTIDELVNAFCLLTDEQQERAYSALTKRAFATAGKRKTSTTDGKVIKLESREDRTVRALLAEVEL